MGGSYSSLEQLSKGHSGVGLGTLEGSVHSSFSSSSLFSPLGVASVLILECLDLFLCLEQ